MASSKGKAREDVHWQLGWWELSPLLDRAHRPLAWSKSSVIFSAHHTKPLVLARHFNSSRHFELAVPQAIRLDPDSYSPPTLIYISPDDDWLFAYFSGAKDNIGCLWHRGLHLDAWTIGDSWSMAHGAGIVAAAWVTSHREWVVSDSGTASRLPPLGPTLPFNSPILLLVTESRDVNVCLLPPSVPSVKILRTSLVQSTTASESTSPPLEGTSLGGRHVCIAAAIGLSYNDPSILIAMRSHLLPPDDPSSDHPLDMVLPLDLDQPLPAAHTTSTAQSNLWEIWGEEAMIELCEVTLGKGGAPTLSTKPLPPISRPGSRIADLTFFCSQPEPPGNASPMATKDPRRQAKEQADKRGSIYLAATFINCVDYTSPPQSEVTIYSFTRNPAASSRWSLYKEHTRTFTTAVLAFLIPSPSKTNVFAGFLDLSGTYRRSKKKPHEVSIGNIVALSLPDLTNDDRWESSPIMSITDYVGRDVPAGLATSPNNVLLCMSSFTPEPRVAIHALPRRKPIPGPNAESRADLARFLAAAVLAHSSLSDIVSLLISNSSPDGLLSSSLVGAMAILENNSFGLSDVWLYEVLGVATEIARGKYLKAPDSAEKALLEAQWTSLHDMCSVATLETAFSDCRDGDSYDLEAIWQLVGLAMWFKDYLERLIKDCVTIGDNFANAQTQVSAIPLGLANSSLLHFLHRYPLNNLQSTVSHVKRLRDDLKSLSPKVENAQMAKELLMDSFACSGVDVDALSSVLEEVKVISATISASELRQCLASFSPIPSLRPQIQQIVEKICSSKTVNRQKLFIKAADLVDAIYQWPAAEYAKEKDRDIVTKGVLLHRGTILRCVRCGGRYEVSDGKVGDHISLRWRAWERTWAYQCICGGSWTFSVVAP
ncbi:unnamed protein product [Somion occarium]|uniref:Mediator complex subunit 16 C-terminal domain-containing protein n=1 Tax=Somion occarium TaxID=3059160 RepID=A0ABP1D9W5_9APHY